MRAIIIGPPGSGKTTQAEAFAEYFHIPHISSGEIFREAYKSGSLVGLKAKDYEDSGKLVPDQITIEIMQQRLHQADCARGFLLDGFPRNITQAYALDEILQGLEARLNGVIDIEIEEEVLLARITNRRVCYRCGEIYHKLFNPPAKENICDKCGGDLYQRSDDTPEIARNRIMVYHIQTEPLIYYYSSRDLLIKIQGNQEKNEVLRDIINTIGTV
jgi:adenylate kinase